jgi:hypothetical protein
MMFGGPILAGEGYLKKLNGRPLLQEMLPNTPPEDTLIHTKFWEFR